MEKKSNWVKIDEQQLEVVPENEIDLFEHPELLPKEVLDVIDKHCEMDTTYESCQNLVEDLEKVGYTCDYGLDGVPYDLKKM